VVGTGCKPSMPVSRAARTLPGATSQVRSKADDCSWVTTPASESECTALASNPAATSTRTNPVILKNRLRLMRTPPL